MTEDGNGRPGPSARLGRILVVEDDRDLRSSIREVLLVKGFLVNVAGDGREALELAMNDAYDVVITDIRMPRMNGIKLSRILSQFGRKPKVIVMTAYPRWDVDEDVRAVNAARVFIKPFDLEDLADAAACLTH